MVSKRIIVIGGGVAGLSAAAYAAMNGYQVDVIEREDRPGGLAATWRRGDYTVEGGPHYLVGCRPGNEAYTAYTELGMLSSFEYAPPEPFLHFVDETADRSIDVTNRLDRLALELKNVRESDAARVQLVIEGAKSARGLVLGMADKPVELMGVLDKARYTWAMRKALRLFADPFTKRVREYVMDMDSPVVAGLLSSMTSPDAPVWSLAATLALVADRQVGLPAGGSAGFVTPLEKHARSLGANIHYSAQATRILVMNGRAMGVEVEGHDTLAADYVISAADGRETLNELLGNPYTDEPTRRRNDSWPVGPGRFRATFGVRRSFKGVPPLWKIVLHRPFFIGNHTISSINVRLFNYAPAFAPEGRSLAQVSFDTGWDHWSNLAESNPAAYREERERLARECLRRLEFYFEGISRQVEMTDTATPFTTWRHTRNYHGSVRGWLPTPEALSEGASHHVDGISGFYMAGHWTAVGGGVHNSILSGKNVVRLICAADGRRLGVSQP